MQEAVRQCQLCGLHKSRTQTVFGTGNQQADWMIIGEAPGAEEDRKGEPFVGRAGQLLNNMLAAVGLPRSAVYIGNVLKCRPPNNRDPKPDESALCRGYLERQIALVNPALILVVGRIAAHNLLQVTTPLGRLRGQTHTLPGTEIPVIVTYHPAYLLRQPAEKRKAWQDLQLARNLMARRG
ncbi:MAG: uracil-DNA glycosylase [Thiolinea sp.]